MSVMHNSPMLTAAPNSSKVLSLLLDLYFLYGRLNTIDFFYFFASQYLSPPVQCQCMTSADIIISAVKTVPFPILPEYTDHCLGGNFD